MIFRPGASLLDIALDRIAILILISVALIASKIKRAQNSFATLLGTKM